MFVLSIPARMKSCRISYIHRKQGRKVEVSHPLPPWSSETTNKQTKTQSKWITHQWFLSPLKKKEQKIPSAMKTKSNLPRFIKENAVFGFVHHHSFSQCKAATAFCQQLCMRGALYEGYTSQVLGLFSP